MNKTYKLNLKPTLLFLSLFPLNVCALGEFDDVSLESLLDIKVVTASRKAESIKDAPSNVTVITDKQIKNWGARDLNDVMRRVAGYTVVHDRDEIAYASRGNVSDNNQKYLILIDGHSINSTENFGPANINRLPNDLSNIKRIEIIRGPGSMTWGAGALAGVINLITKDASDLDEKSHVAVYAGQDGTQGVNFQVGLAESEDVDVIFMGSIAKSDGREVMQSQITGFPDIVDSTGTPITSQPGQRPLLYPTYLNNVEPSYTLQMKARIKDFKLNAFMYDSAIFNGHFESNRGRENYLTNNKVFIQASKSTELSDRTSMEWVTSYTRNEEAYEPFEQGTITDKYPAVILWEDKQLKTGVSFSTELSELWTIDYAAEMTHTEHGPNYRANNFDRDETNPNSVAFLFDEHLTEDQLGGYFMGKYTPNDKWRFVFGSWLDYNKDRGTDKTALSPRLAAIWNASEKSTWKAIYNNAFLRPANFQATSNPEIESEYMDQFEIINMLQLGRSSITTTLFWQKLEGFLNIVSIADTTRFENAGNYESLGIEVEYKHRLDEVSEIWTNFSYAQTEGNSFKDNGVSDADFERRRVYTDDSLLSYPEIHASLGGTFYFMGDILQISPAIRYIGETNYRSIPAQVATFKSESIYDQVPALAYIDVTATAKITDNFDVSLNVFDALDEDEPNHLTVWNGTIGNYGRYAQLKLNTRF